MYFLRGPLIRISYVYKIFRNLNSDSPFTWKVGDKLLSSKVINEQSSGRIQINSKQEIIFQKLQESDKSIYSCWQNNQLAGSIKLEVSYSIEVKFDYHIVIIGGFVILGTFLKVFWNIFRNR
ncbi:uncharacterized protein LOC122505368 [Leptopilina heterotoma]|uniref:uncharacterized protein LOC122505368 n=1 Tax=Leptopilina heterotoma TaxID=63436 RepID=UPI001CA93BC0|nr:uncharacterized protein LOC122505368 [Leptopilina heterotoma]